MGLSGHPHTLPTLCLGKEPLRHIQHEAGCAPKPVLMSSVQRYAFKDNASLCFTSARHLATLPSTKYRISWEGSGGGQLLNSVTYSSPGTVGGQLGILKHWFLGQKYNPTDMSSSGTTQNPDSRVFGMCSPVD